MWYICWFLYGMTSNHLLPETRARKSLTQTRKHHKTTKMPGIPTKIEIQTVGTWPTTLGLASQPWTPPFVPAFLSVMRSNLGVGQISQVLAFGVGDCYSCFNFWLICDSQEVQDGNSQHSGFRISALRTAIRTTLEVQPRQEVRHGRMLEKRRFMQETMFSTQTTRRPMKL